MRIGYITAGAGGMYCGSCLHDNTLAGALGRLGHEVALVPTYTPIRTDETDVSIGRVFYGAVNVYLEQKVPFFRRTPWLVDRILASPTLLRMVSRLAATTDARDLGAMTLSVLQGEHGYQRKELMRLVDWFRDDFRPDIVHITNSMFLGLARSLKQQLGVPVLCSAQGEDIFLDELYEPFQSQVHEALRERARDVDGFVVNSTYYAEHIAGYLDVSIDRVHRVPLGLKLEGHDGDGRADGRTIGYLARICPEKGLHVLAEAFRRLTRRPGGDKLRLKVAGYLGPRDRAYDEQVRRQVEEWGLASQVEFVGEVDREGKLAFLQSIDVLSVPTTYREPKGLFVLEALANAVPVVQPDHGAFPELIEATGGGILVRPEDPEALADGLAGLLGDPARRAELGGAGRDYVHRELGDRRMAERTVELYERFVAGGG